jgi:thiol-disulfide isomerase/thioredoxin
MFSLIRNFIPSQTLGFGLRSLSLIKPLNLVPAVTVSSYRLFASKKMVQLPRITNLKFVKGKQYDVEALRGKSGMVLEFWATWCGPCRQTIPHLTQISKQFPDVPFIGISSGEDEATVKNFVDRMGSKMDYSVAIDTDGSVMEMMQQLNIMGIPAAVVVDASGQIQFQNHPMQPDFVQAIKKHCLTAGPAKVTQTREELMAMPVKDLQKILKEHNLVCEGCLEKGDIVELIDKQCR